MNFGDIWLKTENFIKINLRDFKELKISDLRDNPALINIFNSFDTQKADGTQGSDGELSQEELLSIFKAINNAAKRNDKPEVFDEQEAEAYIDNAKTPDGKTLKEMDVNSSDLFDFMLKLSQTYELVESENELTDEQRQKYEQLKREPYFADLSNTKKKFLLEVAKSGMEIEPANVVCYIDITKDENCLEVNSNRFKKIVLDKDLGKIRFVDAFALAKLDDNQYNLAKDIYKTQKREDKLSINEITDLVLETKSEDSKYLKSLIDLELDNEDLYLENSVIEEFLTVDEPYREKLLSIINDKNIPQSKYKYIAKLIPIWDNLPEDFLQKYPDFVASKNIDGGIGFSSYYKKIDSYLYDKDNGLYEIGLTSIATDTTTIINKKTNTVSVVKYKIISIPKKFYNEEIKIVESETITEYDSIKIDDVDKWETGNPVKTTTRKLGNTEGVYIITETDANGNINPKQLQYETIDENGNTYVQRDCVSPAGVETHFVHEETVDGMVILDYVITGKNEETGEPKTLLNKHQTIQQMEDGRVITTVNGNIYEAKFEEGKLTVTDKQKNITKIFKLDDKFITKGQDIVMNILKNVPANQLMVMDKIPISSIYYEEEENGNRNNNACWKANERLIEMGKQDLLDNSIKENDYETILNVLLPIFLHEFGHYIDSDLITGIASVISGNGELNNIFKKEFTAFLKETNSLQQSYIDYFISDNNNGQRSSQERVAESNMILNGLPEDQTANRASYFQQYFPETIAKIAELIDERIQV